MEEYTRSVHSTTRRSSPTSKFAAEGKKTAVVSTINGDSNVPFYKELGNQGLKANRRAGRRVLGRRGRAARCRHQSRWSATSPPGTTSSRSRTRPTTAFIKKWADYAKAKGIAGPRTSRVTNDPMEATYIGIQHVEAGRRERPSRPTPTR